MYIIYGATMNISHPTHSYDPFGPRIDYVDSSQTPSANVLDDEAFDEMSFGHQALLVGTRPLRVLAVTITELFFAVICGLMAVLAVFNLDSAHPDKDQTPVLFLHGVNHNHSGMIPGQQLLRASSRFRAAPLGSFYSLSYAGLFTNAMHDTFDTYADRAFLKVQQIYRESGKAPSLVGHSMGGLVSTRLAQKCAEATQRGYYQCEDGTRIPLSDEEIRDLRISKVVTLGSPFHGSYIADTVHDLHDLFGLTPVNVYRDMTTAHRSALPKERLTKLRQFAIAADRADRVRFYNVGSTVDQFVPKGYLVTTDPSRQHEAYHLGHLGLLWSPTVWAKVQNWLEEEHPRTDSAQTLC